MAGHRAGPYEAAGEGDRGRCLPDGDGDGLLSAAQLTCTGTVEEAEAAPMVIVPLPAAPPCRRTLTTSVTLWPALSWPDAWLSVRFADEILAVQLTGPPLAVSTTWP